ncbi:hypothetical protein LTR36_005160 [Oleoguttula mirabilis]|uniref:Uncharacterized protein n=1 Tax=Oleoguttula mirabilis TaxID=1507867 RepID=A0AAV9JWE1_9PEZI|nr:hypothetical protein LTR36_005160 [Oleoguttula mirabilis]
MRYVLVEPSDIVIPHGSLPPPQAGLLQTNKQVRKEAISIYYKENTFKFHLRDYDGTVLHKWAGKSTLHRRAPVKMKTRGSRNWVNLLKWLQWYYNREVNGPSPERMRTKEKDNYAVAQLFAMVCEMRKGELKLSWEQVEPLLERVHQVMAALEKGWA